MLIAFSVQNYLSFAKRQTISMVAGPGSKRKEEFSFSTNYSLAPNVLRAACVFGPNGSGKSSLVLAMKFYRYFVISSAKDTQEGENIPVTSFKLDKKWREKPSEFEAVFEISGNIFQYGFAVDNHRVWSEWLFSKPAEPNTKMRTLFQREYDEEFGKYYWKFNRTHLKGKKEIWKNATRDNALFLSTAVQLKSKLLRSPFEWIQKFFYVLPSTDRISPLYTAHQILEAGWKKKILEFMNAVDIDIRNLNVQEKEIGTTDLAFSKILSEIVRNSIQSDKELKIYSYHQGSDGELVELELEEESDGIKVIFSLAGPWLDVLANGSTLVVDELHNSLHPLAFKFLVSSFHNSSLNSKNPQLIFTSHETSVMSRDFMHRDQVWLVEKNHRDYSCLIPLSSFRIRDISSYRRAYLHGRFGAVPKIQEFVGG